MGHLVSALRDVVTRVGQPSARTGAFAINLSSRYRWYLAPARLVIMLLAGAIGMAILWDISRAWLVWQDVQSMESALNQVQDRDRELLKDAQQQGIDLSEAALLVLTGSARALEDVTTLTVTFQDHPQFKEPVLGQHRDMGNGLVEFDLSLRYRNTNP